MRGNKCSRPNRGIGTGWRPGSLSTCTLRAVAVLVHDCSVLKPRNTATDIRLDMVCSMSSHLLIPLRHRRAARPQCWSGRSAGGAIRRRVIASLA